MYGAVMEKERKTVTSAVRSASHSVRRENRTGIPTQLKERMERSTGLSFDDVRVHYNSALPARLDALAYTQGNQVEIGPGQERHLPHELGHVVQQKLGAVRANATHSSGVALNTDPALEHQADELGAGKKLAIVQRMRNNNIIQRCGDKEGSTEEEEEDEGQEQDSQEHSTSSGSPETGVEVGEGDSYAEKMYDNLKAWAENEATRLSANSKKQRKRFNTASIVYDKTTKKYYYGRNKGININQTPKQTTLFGDGSNPGILPETSLNNYEVGNCAEVDAINNALNDGAKLGDLYISTIHTTESEFGNLKKACENCTYTFKGRIIQNYAGWCEEDSNE